MTPRQSGTCINAVGDRGEVSQKASVLGALRLYLDFLNMFLFLLQLMGNRR